MRLGIYGGTFNPIHRGHIHILQEFISRLDLERVLLIPTKKPPHKQAHRLANEDDRIAMCRLATEEIPSVPVEVSRIEMERGGKSYTADTLEELHESFPDDELFLLMGEDMFLTVDTWYRPEIICTLAALCASPRSKNGFEKLVEKKRELERVFSARCFVEDIPYIPISSTGIRELVLRGQPITSLVPAGVEKYILEHKIYGEEAEDDI